VTLPREDNARDLRERILEGATKLFAERGFSGTSVREVVESCHCTKPALYYHFGSKEALFREVVQGCIDDMNRMIGEWTNAAGSVRSLMQASIAEFVDFTEERPAAMRLLQRIELQPEEGAPQFNIMAMRELHLQMICTMLERGIASGELRPDLAPLDAALVIAGALSLQCELSLASDAWDRARLHRTIDLIFDGITP
jgi:AcrR family transcriptional regulator